ncbi:MAG: tetratricopeptide repeat protein [Elusimicrobia bacterium]|nr:tetratricopeptide repeat protein [Elusimicrobiota bacterium]
MPPSEKTSLLAWRGYVAHALLFYRQNDLRGFGELLAIGRKFPWSAGRAPSWPGGEAGLLLRRGLLRRERYWGSFRLGPEALADFERAAALEPKNAWCRLLSGMAHEMARRYARAIVCFEEAMALEPSWNWPWILRGICRWYMADFEGCVADCRCASRLEPKDELALLFMARAKADLKDRSLVGDLDRALKLAPKSGFALSWRGRALFVMKKTPESLRELERSIKLLPRYDRGYSWLGVSCAELGRHARAARLLKKARKLNPYYPTTLYPLAEACFKLGWVDEAGRALRAAAFIDRQGVWVEHRISMSHPNPACRRSLKGLSDYIEERPRAAWAWAWRGQTRLLLQEYFAALEDLDRSLKLAPRAPWPYVWKGEALRRLGYPNEALSSFDKALALDAGLGWAFAAKGHCLLSLGRTQEALEALNASLVLQGQSPQALAWRGEALCRLERWQEAIPDLKQALELYPHARWIYRWLCQAHIKNGDLASAADALNSYAAGLCVLEGENRDPLEQLRRMPQEGGDSMAHWLGMGFKSLREGDFRRALELAGRALDFSFDPASKPALWLRDRAHENLGAFA